MMATGGPESPAFTERFMEAICDPDNIEDALKAVARNKGAPGVDGMTVKQLPDALKARWPQIEVQLLAGRYRPKAGASGENPQAGRGRAPSRHSNGD